MLQFSFPKMLYNLEQMRFFFYLNEVSRAFFCLFFSVNIIPTDDRNHALSCSYFILALLTMDSTLRDIDVSGDYEGRNRRRI